MVVVRDPVCGMIFVKEDAAGQTFFENETYYFCAPSCKKSFDNDPKKYLGAFNDVNVLRKSNEIIPGDENEKDNCIREHN